jgi:hypothetical protein
MASFAEYIDADYLPGEVYSAGLSGYGMKPQEQTEYIAQKRFKFKPEKDDGSFFEQFLALQSNPQAVLMKNMNLPASFQKMASLAGSQ